MEIVYLKLGAFQLGNVRDRLLELAHITEASLVHRRFSDVSSLIRQILDTFLLKSLEFVRKFTQLQITVVVGGRSGVLIFLPPLLANRWLLQNRRGVHSNILMNRVWLATIFRKLILHLVIGLYQRELCRQRIHQ